MAFGHSTSRFEFPPTISAPLRARRHTTAVLRGWRVGQEPLAVAELLVSELVTNAVVHGAGDGEQPVILELERDGPVLCVRVSDASGSPPAPVGDVGTAENGRGLTIVAALSKEWGHQLLPGGGKTVWCELAAWGG